MYPPSRSERSKSPLSNPLDLPHPKSVAHTSSYWNHGDICSSPRQPLVKRHTHPTLVTHLLGFGKKRSCPSTKIPTSPLATSSGRKPRASNVFNLLTRTGGISEYRDFLDLCEMLRSFRDIEVDGLGLPEINLDLLKPAVRQRCKRIWVDSSGVGQQPPCKPSVQTGRHFHRDHE